MKKAKKILIIFIILFTIVLLVIVKYLLKNVQEEKEEEKRIEIYSTMEPDIFPDVTEKQNVKFIGEMKTVEQCIQNFYDTININSSKYYDRFNNKIITDNKINENILNLLSDEYIMQNNININNLENYIKKIKSQLYVVTMDMKYIKTGDIYKYVTYGILIDSDYNLKDKYYFCVNLDTSKNTYSVEPITIDIYNDENMKITIEKIDNKETNAYNNFSSGYEESIDEYFNRIKRLTLTNIELGYNLLDNDYKNNKFGNINEFEEYIQKNNNRITTMRFSSYKFNSYDKYYEYICVDEKGFYYVIKQDMNNCLNFKCMFDCYTIENEEAILRYDNSSNQYKVGINIDKVISAINSKDFEFMYEKLDDSFRSKYFSNATELGKFLQNNLFEINNVSYVKFTENGNDIYTYDLKISSYDEENNETKDMTIIMKLLENRDFIISFSL